MLGKHTGAGQLAIAVTALALAVAGFALGGPSEMAGFAAGAECDEAAV